MVAISKSSSTQRQQQQQQQQWTRRERRLYVRKFRRLSAVLGLAFCLLVLVTTAPGQRRRRLDEGDGTAESVRAAVTSAEPRDDTESVPRDVVVGATGELEEQSNKVSNNDSVPHILYFIHTEMNILENQEPKLFYDNIVNTINLYKKAWNDDLEIRFLTERECLDVLGRVLGSLDDSELLQLLDFYKQEPHGPFRADLCRVAALYQTGGYYFDVDLRALQPWMHGNDDTACAFATAKNALSATFTQCILVATAGNKVLKANFRTMLTYYQTFGPEPIPPGPDENTDETDTRPLLGPTTLRRAYDQVHGKAPEGSCFLEETDIGIKSMRHRDKYPELPRQGGLGDECNYILHAPKEREVYFFSRIVGGSRRCRRPEVKVRLKNQ
jgi:hypothetical protein